MSSLYFRGKARYAGAFGRAASGVKTAYVMTAGGGLLPLEERVTLSRLRGWASIAVHEDNPHFAAPLVRSAAILRHAHDAHTRFVLLGSVASQKYTSPLLEVFGAGLLYPTDFEGRGDMSRGALLLAAVRQARELEYTPVSGRAERSVTPPRGVRTLARRS